MTATTASPSNLVTTTRMLLAAAPRTPTANEEIAASRWKCNDTDRVDGFGRTTIHWPALSPAAQDELAASHRWCLEAKAAIEAGSVRGTGKGRVEAEIARRGQHLDYLIGSVFRLVRKVVDDKMKQHRLADSLRDDLLTEAYALAIYRAGTYDASFPGYFGGYISNRLRDELGSVIRRLRVSGTAPESWHRVASIARGVEVELKNTLERDPTDAEFAAAVESHCESWALAKLSASDKRLPLPEQRRLARKKLVKQGIARGIADLAEIRPRMGPESSLNVSAGNDADETVTRLDLLSEDSGADGLALDELDAARVLRVLGHALADLDPELAAKVIDRLDGVETDGRSVAAIALRTIRARVAAPHTQWAALAPSVTAQFVDLASDRVVDAFLT
jgi:hypothetical protein